VTELSKTRPGYESYITPTNHGNFHRKLTIVLFYELFRVLR